MPTTSRARGAIHPRTCRCPPIRRMPFRRIRTAWFAPRNGSTAPQNALHGVPTARRACCGGPPRHRVSSGPWLRRHCICRRSGPVPGLSHEAGLVQSIHAWRRWTIARVSSCCSPPTRRWLAFVAILIEARATACGAARLSASPTWRVEYGAQDTALRVVIHAVLRTADSSPRGHHSLVSRPISAASRPSSVSTAPR